MVNIELEPGQHTIKMSLANHSLLNAMIDISDTGAVTCVYVTGGLCDIIVPPSVVVNGIVVSGYLKETIAPVDISTWIINAGGWDNLNWTDNILHAYYEYIGMPGYDVEYSPITWDSILGLYYYYLGLKEEGNAKTGCAF